MRLQHPLFPLRTPPLFVIASLGLGVAFVVAASAAAGAAAVAPTSCTVITRAEAGEALGGQKVTAPARGRAFVEGGVACVFYGPNAPKGVSADVPVSDSVRVVLVSGPKAKFYFDDYRARVRARPLSGLGNEAFYDGFGSVSVLEGHYYVRIAVLGVRNPLAAEKKLAGDALRRL